MDAPSAGAGAPQAPLTKETWPLGVSRPPLGVEDLPEPEEVFHTRRIGRKKLITLVLARLPDRQAAGAGQGPLVVVSHPGPGGRLLRLLLPQLPGQPAHRQRPVVLVGPAGPRDPTAGPAFSTTHHGRRGT
jgi:hypothetical protein